MVVGDVGHRVEVLLQGIETVGPQPPVWRQPGVDLGQGLGAQLVPAALSVHADLNQTGLAQHPQVLGGARLTQTELLGEFANQAGPLQQQVEDPSPGRLGKHVERC